MRGASGGQTTRRRGSRSVSVRAMDPRPSDLLTVGLLVFFVALLLIVAALLLLPAIF
jgi:hypothetical protein